MTTHSDQPAMALQTNDRPEQMSRPEPQSQRLAPAKAIDVGEQIVGSRHRFNAPLPLNVDSASGPATATLKPEGSAAFAIAFDASRGVFSAIHVLRPLQPDVPVLEFNPMRSGTFDGDLALVATWGDGHREEQKIAVHGSARNLDEIPSSTIIPTQASPKAKAKRAELAEVDNKNYDADFGAAGVELAIRADGVIKQQAVGVDGVSREATLYKKQQPEPSKWWDLVEIALIAGTGGLAAMAGSLAVQGAEKFLAKEVAVTGAEAATPSAVTAASHAVTHDAEDVVVDTERAVNHETIHRAGHETLNTTQDVHASRTAANDAHESVAHGNAAPDAATHDSATHGSAAHHTAAQEPNHDPGHHGELAKEGLQTAIEDGLKHPIEKALEDHPESASKDDDFFAQQSSRLAFASDDANLFALHLQESLRPLLRSNRQLALAVVREVSGAMTRVEDVAFEQQKTTTSAEYVAYVARASLGSERAQSPNEESEEVTDLSEARNYKRQFEAPEKIDGLLDILIDVNGSAVNVVGARLLGISYKTANRLLGAHLGDPTLGVPLRFVVGRNDSFITRDEAGRIGTSGFRHLDSDAKLGTFDETQENRGAERVVNTVLGRTLAEWGVSKIQTDDEHDAQKRGK